MQNVIIIGISSDIGRELAIRYVNDGNLVIGTYRNILSVGQFRTGIHYRHCDINDANSVSHLSQLFRGLRVEWDTFICSVADMRPVSPFFVSGFGSWAQSIGTNFVNQLRVLHAIYPYRNMDMANVVFFAGMGTNGAVVSQSAICASKIALIKMCELLDHENHDMNVFAIGPGFVRTKIHNQTIESCDRSHSYDKVREFMDSGVQGTSYGDIYNHINWCISVGKEVAGGRNFSTVHDCWGDPELASRLNGDPDMYRLRRSGNDWRERNGC